MKCIIFSIGLFLVKSNLHAQIASNKLFEASKGKWLKPVNRILSRDENYTKRAFNAKDSSSKIYSDSAYDVQAMHEGDIVLITELDTNIFVGIIKYGDYYTA